MISDSKRGFLNNTIIIIVFFLLLSIISVVTLVMLDEVNTDIQADTDLSNSSKNITGTITTNFPSMFDNAFITALGLLWLFSLVAGYYSRSTKVFLIIMIILILVLLGVGMLMSNVYDEFTSDTDLASAVNSFPMTDFVMDNFFIVIAVIGFSIIMSVYFGGRDE